MSNLVCFYCSVRLATIGICVFGALISIGALFYKKYLGGIYIMKRKLITFLLSVCTVFGMLTASACDLFGEDSSSESVETPELTEEELVERKMVSDTVAAFTEVSEYKGSYTVKGESNASAAAAGSYRYETDIPEVPAQSGTSSSSITSKDAFTFTYDGAGKKAGEKGTSETEQNSSYSGNSRSNFNYVYAYIPNGSGYTQYYNEDDEIKTKKEMTQEEIKESVCTLSEALSMMLCVDVDEAKKVTSKEGVVALFQESAKGITEALKDEEDTFHINFAFSDYEAEQANGVNKYTLIYDISVKDAGKGQGIVGSATQAKISLSVKEERLIKIESDVGLKYSFSTSETGTEEGVTYTYSNTGSATSQGKSVMEIEYAYDDGVIPTDFSDYKEGASASVWEEYFSFDNVTIGLTLSSSYENGGDLLPSTTDWATYVVGNKWLERCQTQGVISEPCYFDGTNYYIGGELSQYPIQNAMDYLGELADCADAFTETAVGVYHAASVTTLNYTYTNVTVTVVDGRLYSASWTMRSQFEFGGAQVTEITTRTYTFNNWGTTELPTM